MQVNVHEAKGQFSKLLDLVESGETVIIARKGKPVAELIPARRKGRLPIGMAKGSPITPPGDSWWKPLSDEEAQALLDGDGSNFVVG